MCWRMLLLGVVAVAGYQFNPHDENDYIDDPDYDIVVNESVAIKEVTTTGVRKEDKLEDEVARLLGQPIIHYEEPAIVATDPATSPASSPASGNRPPISPSKPTQPGKATIPHWTEAQEDQTGHRARQKNTRARQRTSEVIYSVRVPQWDDSNPQVGQKFRPGVIESLVRAHDVVRFETRNYPIRPPYMHTTRSYYDPTRSSYETVTYDSRATRTAYEKETTAPAHTTAYKDRARTANKNATWTAYNEGGFRSASVDGAHASVGVDGRRQYLVTIPAFLVTSTTRRPRPTPVTETFTTAYRFTRRTRKNVNCTDSYYECLNMCFDRKGYRVHCPWYTTTPRPEPARMNFTGLFWAVQQEYRMTQYDVSDIFWSWKDQLLEKGYRSCHTFTTRTRTWPKQYPIYYDDTMSKETGKIMAKCWVCGLRDQGIPTDANCYDNFASTGTGTALAEKTSYRRYCRYMDEIPLWFNRSDPYSIWGQWTGGCSYRFLDLSGLYTQRACRSIIVPAQGEHYLSKRMAMLELALRDQKEGCVTSPMATLVPFSRAISLYARFTVCVCRGSWCNHGFCREPPFALLFILCVTLRELLC